MLNSDSQIAILGTGNMGGCLLGGIRRASLVPPNQIIITGQRADHLNSIADEWGVNWTIDNHKAISNADVIMICLKPQTIERVVEKICGSLKKSQLIITIAAGVTTAQITEMISNENPVVRVMPNIASLVDEGAAAIAIGRYANEEHKNIAAQIFEAVGRVVFVKESLLDAVTGLSGSGPAYIYMVIEALSDGGVKMGLPRDVAMDLAAQTVLGAARLIQETGQHPAVLRDQVLTPGGTTIAAVHDLEIRGLRSMLISAVETATQRSRELRDRK
tara:strand:- start:14129 stop:14950 length:822 start_codon:yes stop_codon:yes gene_type:complete